MIVSGNKNRFVVWVLLLSFSFILGWQAVSLGYLEPKPLFSFGGDGSVVVKDAEESVNMSLFWLIWNEMNSKYVEDAPISEEDRVYGAVKGLVKAYGDPYTTFMTPGETDDFNASLDGTLEGIGAEITLEDELLTIVTPLKNSPAEKAGLLPKDIIQKIDGEDTDDLTIFEAVAKIRGEKGTPVVLTIYRSTVTLPFEVSITRDSIDIDSVTVEKLDDGITYLSVNRFNDKTNEQFGKAVSEIILEDPKGLIVDLRFNGGGYLDIAVELLSYLLPSDTDAVVIKERGQEDEKMKTNGNPKILNVPLVVLMNEGSASASEIVAGAIQDHERGIVMGTKSFGKGSVQEVESFNDGSSLRLTIAKWYTPKGRSIDHVGLDPDVVVELTEEDLANEYDSQKGKALEYLLGL